MRSYLQFLLCLLLLSIRLISNEGIKDMNCSSGDKNARLVMYSNGTATCVQQGQYSLNDYARSSVGEKEADRMDSTFYGVEKEIKEELLQYENIPLEIRNTDYPKTVSDNVTKDIIENLLPRILKNKKYYIGKLDSEGRNIRLCIVHDQEKYVYNINNNGLVEIAADGMLTGSTESGFKDNLSKIIKYKLQEENSKPTNSTRPHNRTSSNSYDNN